MCAAAEPQLQLRSQAGAHPPPPPFPPPNLTRSPVAVVHSLPPNNYFSLSPSVQPFHFSSSLSPPEGSSSSSAASFGRRPSLKPSCVCVCVHLTHHSVSGRRPRLQSHVCLPGQHGLVFSSHKADCQEGNTDRNRVPTCHSSPQIHSKTA